MKTIYDKTTRDELIGRITRLDAATKAQWGKMTLFQMLRHCSLWEEMVLGRKKYGRAFIGRLFGKLALKNVLKDEKPLMRNSPSIPVLIITGEGDVDAEKARWIALIEEHGRFSNPEFVHPFFGKMEKAQIGQMVYKHVDHHLRQFNG